MGSLAAAQDSDAGIELDYELEAELEYAAERVDGESASEFTFDEVGFLLGGDWWEFESGIKYESGGSGLRVEEGALRIGASDEFPWFMRLGRTGVPFGQFESHFVEDPLVVVAGEIDATSLVLGFAGEQLDASLSGLGGEYAGDDVDLAASVLCHTERGFTAAAAWTSDLGEAIELREIRADHSPSLGAQQAIGGLSFFLQHQRRDLMGHVEWVGALRSFAPDTIGQRRLQPQAVNVELARDFASLWRLAARWEWAQDLPENPQRQWGAALYFRASGNLTLGADFLVAEGQAEEWPRQLLSVIAALSFGNGDE